MSNKKELQDKRERLLTSLNEIRDEVLKDTLMPFKLLDGKLRQAQNIRMEIYRLEVKISRLR